MTVTAGWPVAGSVFAASLGLGALAGIALMSMQEPVHAAGFDCKYAKSHVEKLICADSVLSKLDDDMKVLFDQIESETFGHDGVTGAVIDPAGKEQKHWRETVRDACPNAGCLRAAYTARLSEMRKKWADALPSEENQ
ncbi:MULTISPECIES: hypothetical protein [unclassified Rhizobium]|uniref:lysozyme inhibitor LprI family protein n=1 Tax=unclassified Rhizobium TaxID=2613769 RepID=UPI00092737FE|nr:MULTISPECIES: hypothetical protein [unclassified Rhizobium]OJY77686.1 MAG: hypothetical protein BGP09_29015 [Rhizobium sp. 60-20]